MPTTVEAIEARVQTALVRMREITDRAAAEDRNPSAEERQQIQSAMQAVNDGRESLDLLRQMTDLSNAYEPTSPTTPSGAPAHLRRAGTPGQQFVDSPEIQNFLSGLQVGGAITNAAFGHSPRVVTNDLLRLGGTDSAGVATVPDQTGIVVTAPRRPLTIENLITVGDTTSDSVEYVAVLAETNNAAMTPEATTTAGAVGAKPESAMTFERRSAPVRTIAHWVPATRQALADAAQLRTIIDSFLRDGLLQKLETQIVDGDGTGENFTGLFNTTGILTQAFSNNIFESTRKGRTKLMTDGRVTPNAWLINPLDMETIDLTQDNEGRYYGQGPFGNQPNAPLWRVPVVEHEAVPQGFALLGDFRRAVLWRRSDTQVMVSDSHADFFVRNLIAVLAEMRAAFALVYPKAVIKVDIAA